LHKSWQAHGEVYNYIKKIHTRRNLDLQKQQSNQESNNRLSEEKALC
jgi:hypothetical protein